MQTALLFALALVIRNLPSADGVVNCPLGGGQRVVLAYSAEFEPIWHHAVPTTIVDRTSAARTGKVTGLGPSDRLVLAVADETVAFDATRPVTGEPDTFPYSPDFARAYEKRTGRAYVRDMMVVVAPNLGSQEWRTAAVTAMYDTLFADRGLSQGTIRSFGSGSAGTVLVVSGRARTWCWLDPCFGDDGVTYAKALAEKGYCVDLTETVPLSRLVVDEEGFVTFEGRRYAAMVLRHLSHADADDYRRTFGNRLLKTKVYATDAPVLYGVELTFSSPVDFASTP